MARLQERRLAVSGRRASGIGTCPERRVERLDRVHMERVQSHIDRFQHRGRAVHELEEDSRGWSGRGWRGVSGDALPADGDGGAGLEADAVSGELGTVAVAAGIKSCDQSRAGGGWSWSGSWGGSSTSRTRIARLDGAFGLRRRAREQAFAVFTVAVGGGLVDILTLVERVGGSSLPEELCVLASGGHSSGYGLAVDHCRNLDVG